MSNFSLVDIKVTTPIFKAAPMEFSKLEALTENCGLPALIVENQSGFLPLYSIEKLLNRVQAISGNPLFLYNCLEETSSYKANTVANIQLPQMMTGMEAAQLFVRNTSNCLIGADFFTQIEGDLIWFLRTAGTTEWTNFWPIQQYNLSVVLRGLRQILGNSVCPSAIRICLRPGRQDLPDDFRDCEIELSEHVMGLALKTNDLVNIANFERKDCSSNRNCDTVDNLALKANDIRNALEIFLLDTETDHSCARLARTFGISERSYRRRLAKLGVTHKQLLSDVRMTKSIEMLDDYALSITQIALELGFAHAPAFTRFFKNRVGVTPSEYRERF